MTNSLDFVSGVFLFVSIVFTISIVCYFLVDKIRQIRLGGSGYLKRKIKEIQHLKRKGEYPAALSIAYPLAIKYPHAVPLLSAMAKVQILAGWKDAALKSLSTVLNSCQIDLRVEYTRYQNGEGYSGIFNERFSDYINAAYYISLIKENFLVFQSPELT